MSPPVSIGSIAAAPHGRFAAGPPTPPPPNAVADGVTFQDSVVRGQAGLLVPALTSSTLVTGAAASGAAIGGVAVYNASGSGNTKPVALTPPANSPLGPPQPTQNIPLVSSDARGGALTRYGRLTSDVTAGDVEFVDANGRTIKVRGNAPRPDGPGAFSQKPGANFSYIRLPDDFTNASDEHWSSPASP